MAGYVEAFSDLDHEIHEMVAEDGRVITRITYNGTHDGEFLGIEPTGIRVEVEEFLSFRIAGGEIVDLHWLGKIWTSCDSAARIFRLNPRKPENRPRSQVRIVISRPM